MLPERPEESGRIELDLGLVRGLAYYNGIIFEVSHSSWPGPLGGGGRYDGLARDLGGSHRLPALGFAYNLDSLVALTETGSLIDSHQPSGVLILAASDAAHAAALNAAREMRQLGEIAEIEVVGLAPDEARLSAVRRGMARMMVVEADGEVTVHDF
jgi:histidyl-tRNA synthetase